MKFYSFFIPFFVLIINHSFAQISEKCIWIKLQKIVVLQDTLTLIPNTIQFLDKKKQHVNVIFQYKPHLQKLEIDSLSLTKYDSLWLCYQTFPFNLAQKKFKRNPILLDSIQFYQDYNQTQKPILLEKREEFLNIEGLNTTGNIVRGISFGNTQNVFVNSSLNLQIDGKISEDIGIKATITDQNVPFQPEGNTQTIQQFDRVLVQLTQKKNTLTAGDIVFRNKENHFLKYYKNVQGTLLETQHKAWDKDKTAITTFGIALAKGKFASIQVPALEGIQGPYRLTGPNGERFIVVIANSEKVFLDGILLKRGFNLDYVIDYNNAEITFTNQVLITQFSRIRVDFEYAERNFNRTIWQLSHENSYKKLNFLANIYQESDNPNAPVNINLTNEDRLSLREAGNNIRLAFVNGIDSTGFLQGQIMYEKRDTLVNNILFRGILVASNNPNKAFFRVTFSQVGQNKGNYIRKTGTANGQVFQWVAPQNGIPQGDFEPIRLITPPNRKRMIALKSDYLFNKNEKIYLETAFSHQDLNLFSQKDNEQNNGNALKIGYQIQEKEVKFLSKYRYNMGIDYEFTDSFFKPIDRFRYIEFDRDWSVNIDTTQIQDHIFSLQTGLKNEKNDLLTYKLVRRIRPEQVDGSQHLAQIEQQILRNLRLKAHFFQMNNTQKEVKSVWNRLNMELNYTLKNWQMSYQFNLDKNKISTKQTDSLLTTAMFFEENRFYLKRSDSLQKFIFSIEYIDRNDFLPQEGKIKPYLYSQTWNLQMQKRIRNNQDFNLIATYRTMQNRLGSAIPVANFIPQNIQGRLDYNATFWDKHLRSELMLNTATGQELKREFQYIAVTNGIGTHTWRDDNGDGIQDLNEFYLAINPDERQFIKVFLPTNEYLKAFVYNFSYRLNAEMPRSWQKSVNPYYKFWSKFSLNTVYTLNRRSTKADISMRFLPFGQNIFADEVLATQANLRNTLFFNRNNAKQGADFTYLQTQNKQLLNSGFELRTQQEIRLNYRKNLHKNWNLRLTLSQNNQVNRSDFLAARNFALRTQQISPEVSYQPNNDTRFTITYTLSDKKNILKPESLPPDFRPEVAQIQQIQGEIRWNKSSKRSLLANLRYWNIRYQGEANSPVGYEMLEALRIGKNWTWNLTWQQRLANGLQLNLTYEGRKSPNIPLVNIGRVQLAALF
ncbi:MAG: hypothetical protein NZ551_12125 [Microscillaceae bacterium]|nr:hypothetical protein [Microscillaceae bacterium]MDW8461942.1 hypothetical protein [Cytophagales bacterium]